VKGLKTNESEDQARSNQSQRCSLPSGGVQNPWRIVWLVGYLSPQHRTLALDDTMSGEVSLRMRRTKANNTLVAVRLSRVEGYGESLGDRSWDSSAKNLFRLVLDLKVKPEAQQALFTGDQVPQSYPFIR
jgi:hypothetical protein